MAIVIINKIINLHTINIYTYYIKLYVKLNEICEKTAQIHHIFIALFI